MANAKIRWTQKVAGREEGHVEVVELDTPFMRGALANRRFVVLEHEKPIVVSVEPSESDLMGLTKPVSVKPAPKPKAPAKDAG